MKQAYLDLYSFSLIKKTLAIMAMGSNPAREFRFFHVEKISIGGPTRMRGARVRV